MPVTPPSEVTCPEHVYMSRWKREWSDVSVESQEHGHFKRMTMLMMVVIANRTLNKFTCTASESNASVIS